MKTLAVLLSYGAFESFCELNAKIQQLICFNNSRATFLFVLFDECYIIITKHMFSNPKPNSLLV